MKVSREEAVDLQTVLNIELEDADVDPYLERSYRSVVQRVNVPGFRKGKAPRRVVERVVGRQALLNEILDVILSEVTNRAIDDQKLDTVGIPRVELIDFEPLSFKATVALQPEVELGAYRDIRVEEPPVEFSEDSVDERLQQLRESMAAWVPTERAIEHGDLVVVDIEISREGETLMSRPDLSFVLEEGTPVPFPEISENLVGATTGDVREYSVQLPDDFYDKDVAGKLVETRMEVKDHKERELPELDDEFAVSLPTEHETLEQLTESLRETEREVAEQVASAEHTRLALEALDEVATVQLPPMIVEHGAEHAWQEQQQMLAGYGIRIDDYVRANDTSEEELRGMAEENTRNQLTRSYAMTKLAELENLDVPEEDAIQRAKELLEAQSVSREPTEGEIVQVRNSMLGELALERLRAIARGDDPPAGGDPGDTEPSDTESDASGDADAPNAQNA